MTTNDKEIKAAIIAALEAACNAGELPPCELPAAIPIARPKQDSMGDLATPVSMQLARSLHIAPLVIANAIVHHLPKLDMIGQVEVVKPGYINLRYDTTWLNRQVEAILEAPDTFGNVSLGEAEKVQVEFVVINFFDNLLYFGYGIGIGNRFFWHIA